MEESKWLLKEKKMDKKRKLNQLNMRDLIALKSSLEKKTTITYTVSPKTKPAYTSSYTVDHTGSTYYMHVCARINELTRLNQSKSV